MKQAPIAVFDSGLGGLSVLRKLIRQLPNEDFLYFGDSLNAPYGARSTQSIRTLTLEHGSRLIDQGAKALVIACNTATSAAVQELRLRYPEKIIVGIEPALKPAVDRFPGERILVMATDATLREEKFSALMGRFSQLCTIIKCPCPGLVEFVERGERNSPALLQHLQRILSPHLEPLPRAIVLGCTHYPFLTEAIRQTVGPVPELFDGADGTAKECRRRLEEGQLLNREGTGSICLTNSADDPRLIALSHSLLSLPYSADEATSNNI